MFFDKKQSATMDESVSPRPHAMSSAIAKNLVRAVGILIGLPGFGLLSATPLLMYCAFASPERGVWTFGFCLLPAVLALYLIYVAYLAWRRFSPLAVRHVCGVLAFGALVLIASLFTPMDGSHIPRGGFVYLGGLIAVYYCYQAAARHLTRLIFTEGSAKVQP